MAETLTELVARISTDATELKKGLTDAEGKTEASAKKMAESLKKVGAAMAASGAAITAALGMMGKAAIDEDINIKHLQVALKGVGVSYDDVKESLEGVIAATQRKTGIADNEQRDVLARLILVTKDYQKALKLLPLTLDMAAYSQMNTSSAATYLAKAYEELEAGADKIGIRMGTTTIYFKDLNEVQKMVGGTAEAMVNPFSVLKAAIGDVAEAIGMNLIPLIKQATGKIVDIAEKVQVWAKENPALAKTLTIVALALGGVLTAMGGLILMLPIITKMVAAFGIVFHAALGPIGLISMAAVAAGIALWRNWDKVSKFFINLWSSMKIAVLQGVDAMLAYLEKFLGWIPGIGDKIRSARDSIANMIDSEKVKQDIRRIERELERLTETVKAEYSKQRDELIKTHEKEQLERQKAHDQAIKIAEKTTQAAKEEYKKEQEFATKRYNWEISKLDEVYNAKLKTLNAEADAATSALQQQIDAIDKQTATEDLILTRAAEQNRLRELESAIYATKTAEDRKEAIAEYTEYETQIRRTELLRQRSDIKDQLRDEINKVREATQNKRDKWAEELETQKANLKEEYDAKMEHWKLLEERADEIHKWNLGELEKSKQAQIIADKEILDSELKRLDDAERAEVEFYARQLAATQNQIRDINLAYNTLTKRYDIEIVTHQKTVYEGAPAVASPPAISGFPGWWQEGGIFTRPAIIGVGEAGPEAVVPLHEARGLGEIIINFTQPVFFDREDTMNRFVELIRKGIQRQDRLRFGGAYAG